MQRLTVYTARYGILCHGGAEKVLIFFPFTHGLCAIQPKGMNGRAQRYDTHCHIHIVAVAVFFFLAFAKYSANSVVWCQDSD